MAATWRVFGTKIALQLDRVTTLTLATAALHNYLLANNQICTLDKDEATDMHQPLNNQAIGNLQRAARPVSDSAKQIRDKYCVHFNNEGSVDLAAFC